MKRQLSIKRQSIWNSFGSVVLLGTQWVISVIITRLNGFSDAGIFSLAMTISNVFSTIANYGLRNYQVTDQSRKQNQGEYLIMRLTASILAILICTVYIGLNSKLKGTEKIAILFYMIYSISIAISDVLMGGIQLKNHLEINGFSNCIRAFSCFFLFSSILFLTRNLVLSLFTMSIAAIIVLFGYDLRQYRKYYTFSYKEFVSDFLNSWLLYKEGFPLMVTALIPMLITAYPRIVIQQHLGADYLGYFAAVYTPSVILSTAIPPMLIGFLPDISICWAERRKANLITQIFRAYGIVFVIVAAAYLGSLLLGKWFITLLYGDSITPYSTLLNSAIIATGLWCVCICGNNILVAVKHTYITVVFSCVALIVVFALTIPLVSSNGIYGASYALIIAYTIQSISQICYLIIKIIPLHS